MKRGGTVLAITLCLAVWVVTGANSAEFTMKFANPVAKDHSWGKGAKKFAELVKESTNGRVEIKAHHAGTLGKIRETLEMARVGTVDFVVAGAGQLTAYVPEYGIVVLPLPVEGHADHVPGPGRPLRGDHQQGDEQAGARTGRVVGQRLPPHLQQPPSDHETG